MGAFKDSLPGMIANVANTGMGMLLQKQADQRQIRQQERLQNLQIKGAKDLGIFNQGLAMKMWENTNAKAQVKALKEAGLNVGLMYGGAGGAGGTTAGGSAGSVTGGVAPAGGGEIGMAMQLGLQKEMQAAQVEVLKSQAKLNEAEAAKKTGVDTELTKSTIEQLKAATSNTRLQGDLLNYQKELAAVEVDIKNASAEDVVKGIAAATRKMTGEADSAVIKGEIDAKTKNDIIKQVQQASIEQSIRILAGRAGLIKTTAETEAVNKGIQKMGIEMYNAIQTNLREWQNMNLKEREYQLEQIMTKNATQMQEFNTSTPQQIKQWVNIWSEIVGTVAGVVKGGTQ